MSNNLDNRIKKLLLSHGFFRFGRSAFDIFLNVMIWKITGDIKTVAIFNLIYGIVHTSMFVLLLPYANRHTNLIKKTGLIGFILFYILLALLGESIAGNLYFLAILVGVVNGTYWLPYQIQRFDVTHYKNRGNYTGIETASKTLVKLLAPPLGGLIIVLGADSFGGYKWLFLAFVILFFVAYMLSDDTNEIKEDQNTMRETLRDLNKTPKTYRILFANLLSGFGLENGALSSLIIPLVIFQTTREELTLGGWLSAFAIASILTSYIVGKHINFRHYDRSIVLGSLILVSSFAMLLFSPSFFTVLLFAFSQEITMSLMSIPRRVYSENILLQFPNFQKNRIGYFSIREIFNIGIGMSLSYLVVLYLGDLNQQSIWWLSGFVVCATLAQNWLLTSIKYAKITINQ